MEYITNMLATVRKELRRKQGNWPFIAKRAGVSYSFVAHVANGHTPDPGVRRLQKVLNVLKKIEDGGIKLPD